MKKNLFDSTIEEKVEEVKVEKSKPATENYKVTVSYLNVRELPIKDSVILKEVAFGDVLEVFEVKAGWAKLAEGFVMVQYLEKM